MQIQHYIKERQDRIEKILDAHLASGSTDSVLHCAMSYAVLGGGKRLRPILAYASAQALGAPCQCADVPAAAVELIHSYSLVHDDLPAMDDDVLRRGLPTCHVAHGEATAILAGDALQALAFELLAESQSLTVNDAVRLNMMIILSKAIGWKGMAAGQSIDFNASGSSLTEEELAQMHGLKTGALISASVRLGALSTGLAEGDQLQSLETFSSCIGLAFQVHDDILDVEGSTDTLGKQQGKDQELNKPTYPSILGIEGARQKARELYEEGIAALEGFGPQAEPLREIAHYIIQRSH